MKALRTSAVVLALTSGLLALSAQAEVVQQNASGDPLYTVEAPKDVSPDDVSPDDASPYTGM